MLGGMSADLQKVAEELYALPVSEFTATRNRRAADVRADDAQLAKAIRALPRPSLAAWVVNMLVRDEPDHVDRVLALGEELRQAQQSLDARQLRELGGKRRKLTAAVTRQAREGAAGRGVQVSDAVAAQVEQTLHAAMIDEYAARAVRTALLVTALPSGGLDEIDVSKSLAVPDAVSTDRPRLSVVPPIDESDAERRARLAVIDSARAAAKKRHAAQARVDDAHAQLRALEARDAQLADEVERLTRRLDELRTERDGLELDLVAGRERLRRATERYDAASEAADRASAALDAPDGDDVP